ncbi:MAG TPA: class I SAM-dependent methyltransferase [Xanthobacteraceae bacterium]|jgi:cephalosporin hydroxylase
MAVASKLRHWLNGRLRPFNIEIATLTAERNEMARLQTLEQKGYFDSPAFPVLSQFAAYDPAPLLESVRRLSGKTSRFSTTRSDSEYSYVNAYFTSPDAEIAYTIICESRPRCIIEVGSGNSTLLLRSAIEDAGLATQLISIDPQPRRDIERISHKLIRKKAEDVPISVFSENLHSDDVLFIDSSHELKVGNDVLHLFFNVLPVLPAGVLIHVHDVFLPFDYPKEWIIDRGWECFREQYLVQALLQGSREYEVLWPGHYLQRTFASFSRCFDFRPQGLAASLWLRKLASP